MDNESFSKMETEVLVKVDEDGSFSKPETRQTRPWLIPLFMGTGLGIAIALGGISVFTYIPSRQQSAVAKKAAPTVNPAMTVKIPQLHEC